LCDFEEGGDVDVFTHEQRSAVMARIRGKDTKPEIIVRSMAHALGYRFRLHRRDLPGTPDLVFPRLEKVIFVHGCFWHQHPGCRYAYQPKSNSPFWKAKFSDNRTRDDRALKTLRSLGWKVLVVWECQTHKSEQLLGRIRKFLEK
jgi:DNA mismatch endonuclease (patch repair protein)